MNTLLTAGVDAGSSSVKVVLLRNPEGEDGQILSQVLQKIRRRPVLEVVKQAFEDACQMAKVAPMDFHYIASTGDGDAVPFHSGHFFGMTTHARGALYLMPDVRAVLDIGALHARALLVDERGKVLGQRMTSQCASGSGQFLENIARYLGVAIEDVGDLSLIATQPESISSICAVLSETDVINMVSRGIQTQDILKGIHLSIAGRLARLLRSLKAEGQVGLTGGLAGDQGLIAALDEALMSELDIKTHPDSIYAGALGAALLAARRYRQLAQQNRLDTIAGQPCA